MKWPTRILLTALMIAPVLSLAQQKNWNAYPAALNPSDEAFVKSYIDRYRNGLVNLQKDKTVLIRFIEYVLTTNGIPKELKNLAVTESYLSNTVVSGAGAAGPWQFMPETARGYGLRVDKGLDERFDVYKSTYAAAQILKQLFRHFKDWNLVLAAYSCGPDRIDKAIQQSGSSNFWDIEPYLPLETRNHVKKFISITHVLDNKVVTPWQPTGQAVPDSLGLAKKGLTMCYVAAGYSLDKVAAKLDLDIQKVQSWNPLFDRKLSEQGFFWLILPIQNMPDFLLYKNDILELSIEQKMQQDQ
jgi:membrane-bound lytic murein transglycosylase D